MAADYEILAQIEVLLKGQQVTARRLDELEKGSDRVEKSLKRSGDRLDDFGKKMLAAFSVAVIGRFAQQSVLAFAEIERRVNAVGLQMRNLGLDADAALPRIVGHLKAIEASGGPAFQDTLAGFQKLVGITRDVEAALFATTVAANISETGNMSAASAAEALANVLQGRASEAAKTLGIQLVDLNGKTKSNAEILEEIIRQYEGAGDAFDDTKNLLDKNAAGWEELKRAIGESISSGLQWLDQFGVNLSNLVLGGRAGLAALAESFRAVFEGDFANIGQRALQARLAVFEEAAKQEVQSATAAEEGKQKFLEQARRAARAKDAEEAKKAEEEKAKEAAKIEQERLRERARIEQESEDALLAAKIRATEEWSEDRLKLETELLERTKQRSLDAAMEVGASTLAINEAFLLALDELRARYQEEAGKRDEKKAEEDARRRLEALQGLFDLEMEAAAENRALQEELEIEALEREREYRLANWALTEAERSELVEQYEKIIFNTRKRYRKADMDEERTAAMARIDMAANAAQQVAGIMLALFGKNKSVAIAAAIIDTIAAAVKAFNQGGGWPSGLLPMAVTLAMGYQRVQQIRATDPTKGGGFDDPANDRLAYLGGRRWAEDMIRNISAGFRGGLAAAIPGSPTSNVSNSYRYGDIVINVGSMYGGDAGLRQLRRDLDQAARRDAARRMR